MRDRNATRHRSLGVSACRRLSFQAFSRLTGCWTPDWCPRVWADRRGRAPIYLCCWPEGVSGRTPCSAWNPVPPGIPPWHWTASMSVSARHTPPRAIVISRAEPRLLIYPEMRRSCNYGYNNSVSFRTLRGHGSKSINDRNIVAGTIYRIDR